MREKKGLYALSIILICQLLFSFYLNYYDTLQHAGMNVSFPDSVQDWMQSRLMIDKSKSENFAEVRKPFSEKSLNLFSFDPNTISVDAFQLLGLSIKQATMIDKYRSRGGHFRTKSDFKKMYCISPQEYQTLEPWISLPDSILKEIKTNFASKPERQRLNIDLSFADSTELLKLPGIGPAFARRIVNFRTKLGGFYSIDQIKEVWGMTDSLYSLIKPQLTLSDTTPANISINVVSIEEIGKHPYVGFSLARVIVNYREQHGVFSSIEHLKKVPLVTDEIFRKLAPYLVLDKN